MPKGPQGQKRPADAIGTAIHVARIAIGEEVEDKLDPSTEANRRGGQVGGKARANALSADERKAIAKKAAATRWGKTSKRD